MWPSDPRASQGQLQRPAGLGENSRNVKNSSFETRLMKLCRAASGQIPLSAAEGWRLFFTDGAWGSLVSSLLYPAALRRARGWGGQGCGLPQKGRVKVLTVLVPSFPCSCCALPGQKGARGSERGRDCFLGESMRREGRWLLKLTRLTTTGHLARGTFTLGSMCQKGQRKGTLSTQLHACLWAGIPLTHPLG